MNNEQIEIQRKRFESARKVPHFLKFSEKHGLYIMLDEFPAGFLHNLGQERYNALFEGWLLCVESNELHITEFQDATFNIARREIIDDLIRQRFRVKV